MEIPPTTPTGVTHGTEVSAVEQENEEMECEPNDTEKSPVNTIIVGGTALPQYRRNVQTHHLYS